uniref:Signal recognition particle receptor subunit alpha-like n=1 Tax=Dermatophagoides pteronyssinus TaxID=6956 RepID=A0A6P6Y7I2_DERPT
LFEDLVSANVHAGIADQLVAVVKSELLSANKAATNRNLQAVARKHVLAALVTFADPLASARRAVLKAQLHVIVLFGTNGVGKSTTLAKLATLLRSSVSSKILVAACDTFRSGAVEQLALHAQHVPFDLFQQGYGLEPSAVASRARQHALARQYDVLIVDTAGRLHTANELLKQLSAVVDACASDLNVFVCEATVGSSGLAQLCAFDETMKKQTARKRGVDGIILTKLDCVDGKMGTVLNVAFESKKPVLFVGNGQTYADLRVISVSYELVGTCRWPTEAP